MNKPREMPEPGVCVECVHAQALRSAKGTVFWLCRHPDLPKYPRLPVKECKGLERSRDD